MNEKRFKFLENLMNTASPTGFEEEAALAWRTEARKFAEKVYTDTHGNSFAVVNPGAKTKVMLAGHIDEIGLMVTHVDNNGFLYFTNIGGWDPQVLPGQHVNIKTKGGIVPGVIGRSPIHLLSPEQKKAVVKFEGLWIDIGAKDNKEASEIVSIGDSAVVRCEMRKLRNDRVVGRGFDDRIGAFVILEALKILSKKKINVAVCAVATTQEEIGVRGSTTSAFSINPDLGIAVDVDFTSDTPGDGDNKKKVGDLKMGEGPTVTRGANINPKLFQLTVDVAKENKIPIQIHPQPGMTGTDARSIQTTRSGVPTALISIPNRYMHSPCEMVSLRDVENAAKLIALVVASLSDDSNFNIGE